MTAELDWSPAHIMAAISLALRENDMEAAASLVRLLAVKDPASAELIVGAVSFLGGQGASACSDCGCPTSKHGAEGCHAMDGNFSPCYCVTPPGQS